MNKFLEAHDHEGGAIPVFKLIKMMSLHDPRWGKPPEALRQKDTVDYRREMFPD